MTDETPTAEEAAGFFDIMSKPQTGNYTEMDRYRDFRALFLGTDQGRRVLYEILGWGHMFRPSFQGAPIDPNRVMIHEGERNMALKVLSTINKEPVTAPVTVNRSRGNT